ncbi:MAG: site-specific integrase [Bacteroides ovatus]
MSMKRNYFSVLFYIKKAKLLKNGEAPICLRITVNGKRAEIQIKRSVEIGKWNAQRECAIGKDRKHLELNHYLETVRTRVLRIHRELEQDDKPITAEILKNLFYGESQTPKMLLEVFKEHNTKYRELIGKDVVKATVLRYERTVRYLEEFLKKEYQLNDIPLYNINHEFISNFEFFIKTEKNCAQNATVKYLKNLKKIIILALTNKWMTDNPFSGIRFKQTQSNREFLSEEELHIIMEKKFKIPRLEIVRDIFVFCCLSGLAFTDIKHLRPEHITKGPNGENWIRKPREKTNNMCHIPLLDIPALIVEKYKNNPICVQKNMMLPVPCNQLMNSYLKEIADMCGITKKLTTHVGRHTFACIALANKVSMETIARMLGHSDIRTTKIYAKVLDTTVSKEMEVMKHKFAI